MSLPSVDPLVASASQVIGGPIGRYARIETEPPDGSPSRTLLSIPPWRGVAAVLAAASTVLVALGIVQKGSCLQHGWSAPQAFWKACYSDFPGFISGPLLDVGRFPYSPGGESLAHPVGTGVLLWVMSVFIPDGAPLERQQQYVVLWAVVAAVLAVVTTVATVRTCRRRPWSAAHVALSPLLVTVALVAPDLWGVALTSVAVLLWSRDRPAAAGVVFGLAIVTRTYPLLVVVVLGMLAARAGAGRAWARLAGSALLTTVAAFVVASLAGGRGVFAPYQVWAGARADYGSLWYLATLAGREVQLGALTLLVILGWAVAILAGLVLTFACRRRPALAEVAILVLVLVLVAGKSLPVQSSLWLIPLVALAGLGWRTHLVWASTEVLYFVFVWLYLGGIDNPTASLPPAWFGLFLFLRLLGLGVLAWAATRQALRRPPSTAPTADLAALGEADEAAGPMTGAPDALVVTVR